MVMPVLPDALIVLLMIIFAPSVEMTPSPLPKLMPLLKPVMVNGPLAASAPLLIVRLSPAPAPVRVLVPLLNRELKVCPTVVRGYIAGLDDVVSRRRVGGGQGIRFASDQGTQTARGVVGDKSRAG